MHLLILFFFASCALAPEKPDLRQLKHSARDKPTAEREAFEQADYYCIGFDKKTVVKMMNTTESRPTALSAQPKAASQDKTLFGVLRTSSPVYSGRIGRLAGDNSTKGQGLGKELLFHAIDRVEEVAGKIGIRAIVVDAKNKNAENFYLKYGFQYLQNTSGTKKTLFLVV